MFGFDKEKSQKKFMEKHPAQEGFYEQYGFGKQEQTDFQGFINSDDHKQWLNSPWDSGKDIHMLKAIVGAMHMHGGYGEEDTQRYLNDYSAMLEQVSSKKGSPAPQELHQTLREMQYG